MSDNRRANPLLPPATRCWILTDGKIGDEVQCLGIAEALGLTPELRRVAPRERFAWAMPFGPIDPREAPHKPGSPIAPPFPDLAIAAGRRSVPYLRTLKKLSRGATFTVFLKDPYCSRSFADLIIVPEHDRLRGGNILTALTPANRISTAALSAARETADPRLAAIPAPRIAMLLGGPSIHHRYGAKEAAELAAMAARIIHEGKGLVVTPSRRTPPGVVGAIRAGVSKNAFVWDGSGGNPYLAMLAFADAIIVTGDSVNMVGEAVATGKPVTVYEPSGGHKKIDLYLDRLEALGAVRRWRGKLETWTYPPINATPAIAAEIARRYHAARTPLPVEEGGQQS